MSSGIASGVAGRVREQARREGLPRCEAADAVRPGLSLLRGKVRP